MSVFGGHVIELLVITHYKVMLLAEVHQVRHIRLLGLKIVEIRESVHIHKVLFDV